MSENGDGSNKLVAYATAAAIGAGGIGGAGSTWWSKGHQHEERDHQHEEIVELRRGLAEVASIVKTREAVNKYWIERLRELEKRQRAGQ